MALQIWSVLGCLQFLLGQLYRMPNIFCHFCCAAPLLLTAGPQAWWWRCFSIEQLEWVSMKVLQKPDVNLASRSDTISSGAPCSLKISRINIPANLEAVTVEVTGTKWQTLENLSVTTQMLSFPERNGLFYLSQL